MILCNNNKKLPVNLVNCLVNCIAQSLDTANSQFLLLADDRQLATSLLKQSPGKQGTSIGGNSTGVGLIACRVHCNQDCCQ